MKSFRPRLLVLLVLACGLAPVAVAQSYPARAVRFVVPFPPGGGVDIVARSIGEKLSQRLGQPVVIDNKPGAGTTIGTDAAAKSAPDGYTFLVGPIGGQAIVLLMHKKLSFDIRRDFAPVTRIGYGTVALIVPQSSKARSVADLVALAKASPGKLTYASSGVGALIHLTGEMFTQAAGVKMVHVPYKGTTQILPDLLDGRVDMALDSLPAYLPHLKSGKVRALAVAARKRSAQLPEQPTLIESGLSGVVSATDYALFAPAGTPKEAIALVNRETNAVLQMPDLRAKLLAQGIEVSGSTPEALKDELLEEIAKWAKVIQQGNIKVD
ncbi:MAG: Bug family tripartite tricarboxylate transporter substrate binding protein [Betaproteobacteria bacterium]